MLTKRIIPCLDIKDGVVVKGTQFKNHHLVGDIIELAQRYNEQGADELVFYDITASSDNRTVDKSWIKKISKTLNIPFCVAGGIRTLEQAEEILNYGADKISINSPALENPVLIEKLVNRFGSQCVVIGIDSMFHAPPNFTKNADENNDHAYDDIKNYFVYQYTGDATKTINTKLSTAEWVKEVQERGAGEIVLNCMNNDGVKSGYDIRQLSLIRARCTIPLIASGGAGQKQHFVDVFQQAKVDGALAASVFHKQILTIAEVKEYLTTKGIKARI